MTNVRVTWKENEMKWNHLKSKEDFTVLSWFADELAVDSVGMIRVVGFETSDMNETLVFERTPADSCRLGADELCWSLRKWMFDDDSLSRSDFLFNRFNRTGSASSSSSSPSPELTERLSE